MADAVVSVFLDKLVGALTEEGRIIVEFEQQFEEMSKQLRLMQSFLKDVDRRRRTVHILRTITDELRELVYDAEDILVVCSNAHVGHDEKVLGGCLTCISPLEIPFRSQMGRHLREINTKIKKIKEDMMAYLPSPLMMNNRSEELNGDPKRWSCSVFDQTQVVGLEGDANKIKGWLFQASNGLTSIGIVGMGGLGKTTTAQKVFNDKEVEDRFEKKMWVSVSQTFKEEEIMRSMLRNLGDASIGDDQSHLLNKIHHYLLGKSYLVVMDDVWSLENGWWTRLFDGLPKGNGSCIIITTRIEEVARRMGVPEVQIHRPKLLTRKESWLLFCKIAFAGRSKIEDSMLIGVGKEIVEKCGGLPLTVKAVGGMMSCKPLFVGEWRRIADNFREELAQNDDLVMASLQLSYDELPTYLKPCFLCYSIYPEDCIINKDQLIHWWIGEGFVPMRSGRLLIESAEDCFMGLVNRCLVEVVNKNYNENVYTCKIHDLVRDLVINIAKEEAFCKLGDARIRRSRLSGSIEEKHLESNMKLRSLVSTTNTQEVNKLTSTVAERICDCQNLRILDLSESILQTHVKDVLNKIGFLRQLTYLSLRNVHPMIKFPHSVKKLQNLQILDVSFCHNLRVLPSYIVTLEKLIVLDVSCCGLLKHLPKGLGRLVNLQVLKGFKPARSGCADGCHVGELKA